MIRLLMIGLLTVAVNAPVVLGIEFTEDSLRPQEGFCGQLFKLQLSPSGGAAPYSFKIESGQLASGLTMSNEGLITGSPKDTGTFQSKIVLADSSGATSKGDLTITIKLPPPPQPLAEDTSDAKWHKPGWQLTFHDEFDGQTLDRDKWGFRYTTIPSLCVLENGIGHLRFEKDFPPQSPGGGGRISGLESRRTNKPLAQQYGYFELRAKTHKGPGGQCAFWLTPIDGRFMRLKVDGGTRDSANEANELDIFEQQGNDPHGNNFTVHYGHDPIEQGADARHVKFPFDLTADFHVYAIEWNAKRVTWYVDGQQVHTTDKVPHTPFFMRLGIYEGDSAWSGKIDKNDPYPKDFEIDYVRVYRKAER